MNLNKQRWVFYLFVLPLLLFSCGGSNDDPITPPEPPEPPVVTEGGVAITPDVSTYQPGALTYHFYGTDGQIVGDAVGCDGQGNYNNSAFAVGTYRVLAVNTSASGVGFRDMGSQASACVYLPVVAAGRSGGFTMVSQPGPVYSVVVNDLTVAADATASHSPVPVLLTHSLAFPLSLGNSLVGDVVSISGVLHGVYPSVSLFSCTPASSVSDCEDIAVSFTASGSGATYSATVNLFGLCDPQGGAAYTNILYFTLAFSNGDTQELSVDLTDALTDAIADNQGSFPSSLQIPVVLERTAIGLDATVGDWSVGGESEKEL